MATKREELENPDSCLSKAAGNEPLFVLRGQDTLAPLVVEFWAKLAFQKGVPLAKRLEARRLADQMKRWPERKVPD
jgi:hypothetical protein